MEYSTHVASEGTRRYESTIARVAPSVSLRGEQVALKRNFGGEIHIACIARVAPLVSLRGRQVALKPLFGIEITVAWIAPEVTA